MMKTMIFVALGGAVGASLRYLVGLAVAFPLGTLGVNVIGSFAIGLLWAGFEGRDIPYLMPLLMTGVSKYDLMPVEKEGVALDARP